MDSKYDSQFYNVNFSEKDYTVKNLIPILDFDDKQKICIEINEKLTQLLKKYI